MFKDAGLDATKGIGRAVAKDIERGDYTGEMTAAALVEYAQQDYGWEAPAAPQPDPAQPQPKTVEQVAQDGQERLDAVAAHQVPPPPPEDLAATANQALAEGDHMAAMQAGVAALLNKE